MSRIVSLNIRQGGGLRTTAILHWISNQEPDIVILQEWRANDRGQSINAYLSKSGYYVYNFSDSPKSNGLLIASKFDIPFQDVTPAGANKGKLIQAESDHLHICAAYFPQRLQKTVFFEKCLALSQNCLAHPFILIGDLNTGNNVADRETGGSKFYCDNLFDNLTKEHGLNDLWRLQNGPKVAEWTWLSSMSKGFRIDHALANGAFLNSFTQVKCYYSHETRESNMTDHSALIVEYHANERL